MEEIKNFVVSEDDMNGSDDMNGWVKQVEMYFKLKDILSKRSYKWRWKVEPLTL